MNKVVKDIIEGYGSNKDKLAALTSLSDDIDVAKKIISGKLKYCKECGDYYLAQSFFEERETVPTRICTYSDPINSGGNEYVDGYADITYSVCPKGHKEVVNRVERRK